jgi:hypothetical protein
MLLTIAKTMMLMPVHMLLTIGKTIMLMSSLPVLVVWGSLMKLRMRHIRCVDI